MNINITMENTFRVSKNTARYRRVAVPKLECERWAMNHVSPTSWCSLRGKERACCPTALNPRPTGWLEQINMPDAQRVRLLRVTTGHLYRYLRILDSRARLLECDHRDFDG